MAEIRIKYQELENYLKVFEKQISDLKVLESRCNDAVVALSETWTGTACGAYVQVMQNYTTEMNNLYNILQATKKSLVSVMDVVEAADNQQGDMISGL